MYIRFERPFLILAEDLLKVTDRLVLVCLINF